MRSPRILPRRPPFVASAREGPPGRDRRDSSRRRRRRRRSRDWRSISVPALAPPGSLWRSFAPQITFGLVENDPFATALARDNLKMNSLTARGRVFEADVLDVESLRAAGLAAGSAQLVITNPPFLDPARSRLSAHAGRRAARAMPQAGPGPLAAWIGACMDLLEEGGLFLMIHRPEALTDILAAVSSQAGALTLMPIQPRAEKPAVRILIRAAKGSRAPVTIASPLVLNGGRGFLPQSRGDPSRRSADRLVKGRSAKAAFWSHQ